jgi:DNA polymerase III subunit gamma/tau
MSYYRIYRPNVIGEIDNISVRGALLRLLEKPKKDLPHAFLFSGPRGSGKTTAARLIAKLFNCTHGTKTGPCGTCDMCVSIADGTNLDVLEIDAASNRGIDEIRTLREGINLAPSGSLYKVYIIDEVHMLTTEAFNALLKTLEEPPAHAVFVLATTDPQKVPVTIKSRCVSFVFSKASTQELVHALSRIVKKEKITIDADALTLIAESVDGSFRDGVKFLEQVSFHKGTITPAVVRSILTITEEKTRQTFLSDLSSKNAKESLAVIARLTFEGNDIRAFIADCLLDLEKIFIANVQGKVTDGWNRDDLSLVIRKLSEAYAQTRSSVVPQLPLELAVVEFCEESAAVPVTPPAAPPPVTSSVVHVQHIPTGLLTLEKLIEHWPDIISELKPYNHSVAGVMRSTRPKDVADGIVTIEAFYTFHKDKLSEPKIREMLSIVLKKLFGEKVKVEIVLGKK